MEFGNQRDLFLVKKIEDFSKGKNMEKLKPICNDVGMLEERKEANGVLNRVLNDIKDSNIHYKDKVRQSSKESKRIMRQFLSEKVIPYLVDSGFFESYAIPLKKNRKTKKDEGFYWQFGQYEV